MSSLYDWFDEAVRSEGQEMEKYASCSAITHHVGVLMALGVGEEALLGFVARLVALSSVLLPRVSEDKTLGENLDALLSRPALVGLDGGKNSS